MGGFNCSEVTTRAHFVFFLDFCRDDMTGNVTQKPEESEEPKEPEERESLRKYLNNNQAAISVVCATLSGCTAKDSTDASPDHSPFALAFLENLHGNQ